MSRRPLATCVLALALAGGCASQSTPVRAPGAPGELAWSDSLDEMTCPSDTSLWVMNARRIVQPVSEPPRAVYQRGPAGEMYTLGCQSGYRCEVRPVAAWCQRDDGVEHGPYLEWYEDERSARAVGGDFRDGREQGRWTHWDRSGRVERVETYRDGHIVESVSKK